MIRWHEFWLLQGGCVAGETWRHSSTSFLERSAPTSCMQGIVLSPALAAPAGFEDAPHVIVAKTIFGKGVSYMEQGRSLSQTHVKMQPINWHYMPMSDEEFRIAMSEIGGDD